ncbi:coadhesin-like isoform X2 [Stylophora pistillata]|uniref:Thrombospondin-2 n=2 Tax=Stylophora pistillata TaxID=50429 RepID=A0A2B4RAA6_STYPI|nr:coadhesin-like isoform X2 [Stylophora pistillata]XP_022808704.1 coadhesin-like isoform X2 [Stylophora pistillata]PFX13743.1 Thrombospondin-2 [Stylophora pistillata]
MARIHVVIFFCFIGSVCVRSDEDYKTCQRTWKKVGCYKDREGGKRALPNQMVNIRDKKSNVFVPPKLDWNKYPASIHNLACLCAEKARENGYDAFGLQFYGECWTGDNAKDRYSMFGAANVDECIMSDFEPCDINSEQECVGKHNTNYVYTLEKEQSTPTDGKWSDWGDWTPCDKTCGTGKQVRERTCTNPPPENGGKDCVGSGEEVQDCKLTNCPIDGGYTPWEPATECTKTCGGGMQKLVRTCTNPPPQHEGKDCVGPNEKTEPCNEFPCPTPCTRTLDLAVILDATKSVGKAEFQKSKDFALALVNSMNIAPGGSHLGLMVYNINATILTKFNEEDKQDPLIVKSILDDTNKLLGRTFTDRALIKANDELFTAEGGDRPQAPDVLVLVTDGRTNKDSVPYDVVLPPLKEKGVKIIAVGVGNNIKHEELKTIAMGFDENVIQCKDFEKLFDQLQEIIDSSCESK